MTAFASVVWSDRLDGFDDDPQADEPLLMRLLEFDSIDALNPDGIMEKRKGSRKKYWILLALVGIVFFVSGILIGHFAVPKGETISSGASTSNDNFDYVKFIVDNIDKERIRSNLRNYTSQPRLAGTPKDVELALQLQGEWKSNGLDEVHLATYNVLLSYPNTTNPNVVEIINATGQVIFMSHKFEVPLTDHENNSNVVPPFNSYSAAGNVTGRMLYVNYGRFEDFQFLEQNLSISVNGCIAIARYGKIFRGDKLKQAEKFGALGLIIYSDPADYNMDKNVNNTYPHSWWLPQSGIQRGTVGDDGDPNTPLYPSTSYAHLLPASKLAEALPKIPCQPIGYNDATILLRYLGGREVPSDWQGNLPFTYHLGPNVTEDVTFRLVVNNYNEVKPVHNVIGYIKGQEEPDRFVLLGNHHDAWVFGGADPLSGTAAITELTRVFGLMLQEGHRPRRTIVFCSWDAEEYGLIGSIEWVEDHMKVLLQRAVAYLNLDYSAVSNFTMAVGTSPLLHDIIYSVAKKVPSLNPSVWNSLFDLWLARPRTVNYISKSDPELTYSLGSGSDMASFYQRAGVPSIDMWITYDEININILDYPLYHSSYETFFAYDNFIDPGFYATRMITQFLGILAFDLASSELLPMCPERYAAAITSFHHTLVDQFKQKWEQNGVDLDGFSSAVQNFTQATQTFQKYIDDNKNTLMKSPLKVRQVNDKLIFLERAFLDPEGLPGRPMQKHVVFAPSQFDSYVDNSFPGIVDTMVEIEKGSKDWEQLRQQVYIATYMIQSAANTLNEIGL